MDLFKDIQKDIEFFFADLNWTYILIYVFILYGIKHKEEFDWYNNLFDRNKNLKSFKVWAAGIITIGFFCCFRAAGVESFNSEYVSQLLMSWIMVIVFNSIFNKKIKEYDKE